MPTLTAFFIFVILAISSREIGQFLGRALRLPYITGYLFAGVIFGPFVLNLINSETFEQLRFVDDLALAVIALVAGSELYLREIRSRIKPIFLNAAGVAVAAVFVIMLAMMILGDALPFMRDVDTAGRLALALLTATILLALSPPSTIAVIQEVRARGMFTRTVLSITVVMDVVIIVLFAIVSAFVSAFVEGGNLDLSFLLILVAELAAGLLSGYIVGRMLALVLSSRLDRALKTLLLLLISYAIFPLTEQIAVLAHDSFPFEFHIEPLLVAMVGGFYVTNFSAYRDELVEILHYVGPPIYVAFFTLTGVSLNLNVLIASGLIALVLFAIRVLSVFAGSFAGGTLAGESMQFRRFMWMGLITQAGIALGLAREAALNFPGLVDDSFTTVVVAVISISILVGPYFLKSALRRVGEAHEPGQADPDEIRDVLILGLEGQTVTLARQLLSNHWRVKLADTSLARVESFSDSSLETYHIDEISEDSLSGLMTPSTDAVVMMLDKDDDNLKACQVAFEKFGVKRLIVRLNDMTWADYFKAYSTVVVDPATAMVHLLDQSVRAPQSVNLLLHQDPEYTIMQITVTNLDAHGTLLRDLRLPGDVLILEITRQRHSIVPNGSTALHMHDEVTLIGKPASLEQVVLKLGY